MAREKSTFDSTQDNEELTIEFKNEIDYVLVDINEFCVFISLGFTNKPYDEMITLRFTNEVNSKDSTYTWDKTTKKLKIVLKKTCDRKYTPSVSHKYVDKQNHPLADQRRYAVQKPAKKNWDKIVADLNESDEEEPDANSALKKIYDGCDDDTRRAMEKSLYESKGTVLNMNWTEVGAKKVEPYESYESKDPFPVRK